MDHMSNPAPVVGLVGRTPMVPLTRLAAAHPQAAQLVQLRYFAGLSIPEAAQSLGISPRSADRLWAYARAWLHQEMEGAAGDDAAP